VFFFLNIFIFIHIWFSFLLFLFYIADSIIASQQLSEKLQKYDHFIKLITTPIISKSIWSQLSSNTQYQLFEYGEYLNSTTDLLNLFNNTSNILDIIDSEFIRIRNEFMFTIMNRIIELRNDNID
jgi:hypothetical protein